MKYLIGLMIGFMIMTSGTRAEDNFLQSVPQTPDVNKHYLFYLHGAIIERGSLTPTHPKFGLYDMPAIRQALISDDTVLISEHRPQGTKPADYAAKVVEDVHSLLAVGVPAQNITVSGFSKGGMISILASSLLNNDQVNFVFMASCNRWSFENEKIKVAGRILSIYETSDTIGLSCQPLIDKSPAVTTYEQIALSTGKKHGAFYLPRDEWVLPLKAWTKVKPK